MSMSIIVAFVVLGFLVCKFYSEAEANAYVDAYLDVTEYLKERGLINDLIIDELTDYLCEEES